MEEDEAEEEGDSLVSSECSVGGEEEEEAKANTSHPTPHARSQHI